ncbi:MAG: hypothetical protein JNL57_12420 [Bacteroidetes bacterium]|nr:hypothetical protein [Bacteroidota bacterium]
MNAEKLSQIGLTPGLITPQDALELEQLARDFPWFATPQVLLCRYYHEHNDYRYAENLTRTALRVPDRAWLKDWIHHNPEPENDAVVEELPAATEPHAEATKDIEENETVAILPASEVAEADTSVDTAITHAVTGTGTAPEAEAQMMIENPPEKEEKLSDPWPEEEVFEEIGTFDEALTPTTIPEIEVQNRIEAPVQDQIEERSEIREVEYTGTVLMPGDSGALSLLEASDEDLRAETPGPDLYNAGIRLQVLDETEGTMAASLKTESAEKQPVSKPESEYEDIPRPKLVKRAAVYNIEDYFSEEPEIQTGDDFFSWLSHPRKPENRQQPEDATLRQDEHKTHKDELIDRFIRTNPGVSRPKAEFYQPQLQAKKSETLPDDLVTETLARVYEKQQNFQGAIRIYEKLQLKFPQKSTYFAALIEKIKEELKS